jgi:hypothetical protein
MGMKEKSYEDIDRWMRERGLVDEQVIEGEGRDDRSIGAGHEGWD